MDSTFMVSTGCIIEHESAHERPPAKAAFITFPAGSSTGGATATTVAASNHIFLKMKMHRYRKFEYSISKHNADRILEKITGDYLLGPKFLLEMSMTFM